MNIFCAVVLVFCCADIERSVLNDCGNGFVAFQMKDKPPFPASIQRVQWAQAKPEKSTPNEPESLKTRIFVLKAYKKTGDSNSSANIPESLRKTLNSLDYRSFSLLQTAEKNITCGETLYTQVADYYEIRVSPLQKDNSGRYRVRVAIEENTPMPDGKVLKRKALDSVGAVVPGNHLSFCGLKFDDAELIIVVSVEPVPNNKPNDLSPTVKSFWQKTFR